MIMRRSSSAPRILSTYSTGSTRFFRGKRQDGNWETPFDPFAIGRSYTEATAWQYRFFTPHDVYGLTQLFGGREAFIADLEAYLWLPPR